jgi:hypothetical protein
VCCIAQLRWALCWGFRRILSEKHPGLWSTGFIVYRLPLAKLHWIDGPSLRTSVEAATDILSWAIQRSDHHSSASRWLDWDVNVWAQTFIRIETELVGKNLLSLCTKTQNSKTSKNWSQFKEITNNKNCEYCKRLINKAKRAVRTRGIASIQQVFMYSGWCSCEILNEIIASQRITVKIRNIQFHKHDFNISRVVTWRRTNKNKKEPKQIFVAVFRTARQPHS